MLTAFKNGLLFLPDLRQLPSGGYTAIDDANGQLTGSQRAGFWNLFTRRTQPAVSTGIDSVVRPPITAESAAERFLDSPGALFVQRETILRIIQRGRMFRVERKPGRTVAWRLESPPAIVRDNVRKLLEHPDWRAVVVAGAG